MTVAGPSVKAEEPVPTITIGDVSVVERQTPGKVKVSLQISQPAPYAITAEVKVVGGSATPGADFFDPGTMYVRFDRGKTNATVSLIVNDDGEAEEDETIELSIVSAVGALIGDLNGQIIILDDDSMPRLDTGSLTVLEGIRGRPLLPVSVERSSSQYGSVKYELVDGSAKRGEDFIYRRGVLRYSPAKGLDRIRIPIRADRLPEDNETFTVRLFNPVNMELPDDEIEMTIVDDDVPPMLSVNDVVVEEGRRGSTRVPLTIELDRAYSQRVRVRLVTEDGSALRNVDYRAINKTFAIPPYKTSINVPLNILGNLNPEDDEQFTIRLTSLTPGATLNTSLVTVTIVDDD